jgi:hypothetical protein
MTPPISKDWWLAAALSTATVSATVPAALAQTPAAGGASGVVTAVAPGGQVTGNNDVVVVGSSILPGQRLRTNATGVLHVLFMDQSALTLGPNSELTIDEFTFDPATRQGQIRLGLAKGVLRVVGGQISKSNATQITTPHGKIEILGGITVVDSQSSKTQGIFLFGQGMSVTDNSGNTQTITRAGFGTSFGGNSPPTTPQRVPVGEFNTMLQRLESSPSGNSATNNQPPPAPAGQLLSTGNVPGGTNYPGGTLANDRLKNVIDTNAGANPSQSLRNILAAGQTLNQS